MGEHNDERTSPATSTTQQESESLVQGQDAGQREGAGTPHPAPGTGGGEATNAGEATAKEQVEGGHVDGEPAGPYGGAERVDGADEAAG